MVGFAIGAASLQVWVSMTPRQIIRSRCEKAIWAVLFISAMFVALKILDPGPGYGWIAVVLFVGIVGAGTYATLVIDCPKCQVAFGQMVWQVAYPSMGTMPFKVCPHCSLVLDSPWPASKP